MLSLGKKEVENIEAAYKRLLCSYTLDNVIAVIDYYFSSYRDQRGEPHPPLKIGQYMRIIDVMPTIDGMEVEPESYPALIDAYFKTYFPNCDYRINHFFSGRIREMRFYEELY